MAENNPHQQVADLRQLQQSHPAWRLLHAANAPLIVSFLGDYFVEDNRGATAEADLITALDDYLYAVHKLDPQLFTNEPKAYLDDWASTDKGWLRKFYPLGSDEVHYDVTPAVEKAHRWVQSLQTKAFVGTESRLHTLVELLRQIVTGAEADPQTRLTELKKQRDLLDEQIRQAEEGKVEVLADARLRDRYQLFVSTSRDLMGDFRQVEENFRALDRDARAKIAGWDGGKGDLLADLVSSRSDISQSDEGLSFQAFHDFLLSESRQNDLVHLLSSLEEIEAITVERGIQTIHHDWAEAAERTQQTVRSLSEQLRSFLEDQVWLENRRVLGLIRTIEKSALALRDDPAKNHHDLGMTVNEAGLRIALPMSRPLHSVKQAASVESLIAPAQIEEVDLDSLLLQRFVDTERLVRNIRNLVRPREQVLLSDVLVICPLEEGIAELLGYLSLSEADIKVDFDHNKSMVVDFTDGSRVRQVRMPYTTVTRR